ncbi:MAG: formyltransferase family protein [Ignavibacteriae bacterium]|nr:formyltransferase family protein [Ignavibacteriota bacterium]
MYKNKKYFYLTHGIMGLECLKGLITENYPPEFVVINKNFEIEKKFQEFYEPIESVCSDYDIPLIKTDKVNEIINNFSGFDFGICTGFMEIIGKDVLEVPKLGIFNLHCGKLPDYRGRAPISRTIMNGNDELTMTLHKMDEGVDSGDILFEFNIPIDINDDVNVLYNKCCEMSSDIVHKGIEKLYSQNNISNIFQKQDLSLKPKPNKKISDEERKINWGNNINSIHNLIRALTPPYPSAYVTYEDRRYHFIKSEIFSIETCKARNLGEIYFVDEDYLLINCKDGLLKIMGVQDEENKKINFEEVFKQRGILK